MRFLEILETLEQLRKLSRPANEKQKVSSEATKAKVVNSQEKALEIWEALLEQVNKEHGETYGEWLKKIAVGYGLAPVMKNPPALDEPPPGVDALYQQILPLCELAYLYEKNGDAKEHATKLAMIFNDEQKVVSWLLQYGKTLSEFDYPLHDACNSLKLPSADECHFNHWKKLANESNNLLNPGFLF